MENKSLKLNDYILSRTTFCPQVYVDQGWQMLHCKLNTPLKWGDFKKVKDQIITFEGNQYKIVGIEYLAVSDDRETYGTNLLVELIKK